MFPFENESEPLVLGGELANGEELTMTGALLAALLAGLIVGVGVQVVVVDVLRGVLSVSGVGDSVEAAVGQEVPAGLGLVSEEHVAAVVPSEPSVHLLRKVPHMLGGLLVHPVIQGRVELVTAVSGYEIGESALKSGEHIVEG